MQKQTKSKLIPEGLKKTGARIAVVKILQESKKPKEVSEIVKNLKRSQQEVNQATVYRILEVFEKRGVVNKIDFQEGKFRYEIADKDHHHLICNSCGSIEDISDCKISELEIEIMKKKGFLTNRHSLEFYGTCKKCRH